MKKIYCDIGIAAYNEDKDIGRLLQSILSQNLHYVNINNIYIATSGCTDRTNEIVKEFFKKDSRIKLITQKQRQGKFSAINLIMSHIKSEIAVLCSGDIFLGDNAIENLVFSFSDPTIGAVGCHPVPLDKSCRFIGFVVTFLWFLHHRISMERPKLSEMIAFRRSLIDEIPPTAVDEATIEAKVVEKGYRLGYAKDAKVYNRGAKTIRDFITQRRRIACGHIWLDRNMSYRVSTVSVSKIMCIILKESGKYKNKWLWIFGTILLEGFSRVLGFYDYYIRRNYHFVWKRIT